jgi:hypothetical protein
MANVGSLVVSGQILADPFIAAFLGFLVGVVLCVPRLTRRGRIAAPSASASDAPAPLEWRPISVADRELVDDLRGLPW